jgi:L-serine dehydratase
MSWKFSTAAELLDRISESGMPAPEYLVARDAFYAGSTAEAVRAEMARRIVVTRAAIEKGTTHPQRSLSGLTDGAAALLVRRAADPAAAETLLVRDELVRLSLTYSLAVSEVNACGGRIVAIPTAGSCGIVPGVLWAWRDAREPALSPESTRFQDAFVIASAVGMLIALRATLSGAAGGCQAECGAAAGMAAAGLLHLMGRTLEECLDGAALSLKNSLGLACDPVAGLVEVPCVKRNAFHATHALTAACLAEAGIRSAIPFDEVVAAMRSIGDSLPSSIRESAEGGLAVTPTGLACRDRMRAG